MATLQQQVQQYLQNTGISLRELSRRSGVSRWTISSILKGGVYKSDTADALNNTILRDSGLAQIVCSANAFGKFEVVNKADFEKAGLTVSIRGSEYAPTNASASGLGVVSTVKADVSEFTLHDKVEAIAAERVDCDVMTRDDALECGKQRRIEALEAEVQVWRKKADKAGLRASELDLLVQRRDAELSQANDDTQYFQQQHSRAVMLLSDERKEVQRLTALAETHGQSWKAACVQVEQLEKQLGFSAIVFNKQSVALHEAKVEIERLEKRCKIAVSGMESDMQKIAELQKQLDHGQKAYKELHDSYQKHLDDDKIFVAEMDALLAAQDNAETKHDQQVTRLRVCIWILIAALAFVVVSGFVVLRGGV